MANKPNWKRTKKQMYKSVESCHPIISDTSDIRDEKKEKRKEHIKEFAHIGVGMLCIFIILVVIMALF